MPIFLKGSGSIICDKIKFEFKQSDCYFIPAKIKKFELDGNGQVLLIEV